jgi:hypothetical protein
MWSVPTCQWQGVIQAQAWPGRAASVPRAVLCLPGRPGQAAVGRGQAQARASARSCGGESASSVPHIGLGRSQALQQRIQVGQGQGARLAAARELLAAKGISKWVLSDMGAIVRDAGIDAGRCRLRPRCISPNPCLFMQIPYELALGWRYTRAGRATRRNGFISFISGVSMLGIALGVAALIIVLSVMNGFQKEVRDRMLSVVSHIEIFAPGGAACPTGTHAGARRAQTRRWWAPRPSCRPGAAGARRGHEGRAGARHRPGARRAEVTDLAATNAEGLLQAGARRVRHRAGRRAGAQAGRARGRQVTLIAPSGQVTPAGVVPRLKQMTVAGHLRLGPLRIRLGLALLHMDDARASSGWKAPPACA